MFENLDKIKSVITNIFTQISLNKLSNCHDLNVLAENVFMYVLNDCFDYHLQNANILNNAPNQVGFDLIDTKNKIIFQVTSSDTIEKYSETIKKVKNVHGLEGFNLKFFILKASANKHPASSKIHNLSSPIIFDKDKDILDGNWLFAQFTSHFDRISLIEKHLELLFNGELSYKMIYSLLDFSESICDYPLPEHYLPRKFALKRDTIVEIFQAFRKFCIDNMPKPDFIRLINEIRSVEDTQQEIRLLQILKIKLSLFGDETDLEKCIDVLQPDSINDFGIATWLTNNYDNAWNLLHYDLVHKKFPKRRFYHPNEMKLGEEKSMELLLDYAQFKETVLYIVNQYAPKARKELYAKVKECEENKWDSYVGSFMSLFYNYKTQEYDLQEIKNNIEDQSLYELFVLDQLANHRIKQLTGKQKNCLKVILEHVLPKIKDNRTGQRYLSLALDYEITLDKDVQEICLKYASVRDSRWEHAYSHKPFIDYAVQELGKERAEHRIISLIKNPKGLDVCDYLELAKYAINAHLSGVYSYIFEFIKHDEDGYSGNIINLYLKSEPDGMEQIMAIFQDIPDKHKAYVLKMLMCHLKDDMQWVKDTLAHFKDTLLKYDKKTYLECQALLGNQEALEEILKCMTEDKYYFGNVFTAIRFCNYTIDSLPVFDKLLDLSFTMDSSFWTSSIIDGIKGMVGTSSVNLEKVIKVLSSKITDERTWLNKTIDSIKYSYYEAVDSHMTIELAAEKVRKMKMLSNSLNI